MRKCEYFGGEWMCRWWICRFRKCTNGNATSVEMLLIKRTLLNCNHRCAHCHAEKFTESLIGALSTTNPYPAMKTPCFSFVGLAEVSFLPGEGRLAFARPAFD
jgi:hypothetical protein